MSETNVFEFIRAIKENYDRKMNADNMSEFKSSIIDLQGKSLEMYATNENLPVLKTYLCMNKKMFEYQIDSENISNVKALVDYKKREKDGTINSHAIKNR